MKYDPRWSIRAVKSKRPLKPPRSRFRRADCRLQGYAQGYAGRERSKSKRPGAMSSLCPKRQCRARRQAQLGATEPPKFAARGDFSRSCNIPQYDINWRSLNLSTLLLTLNVMIDSIATRCLAHAPHPDLGASRFWEYPKFAGTRGL